MFLLKMFIKSQNVMFLLYLFFQQVQIQQHISLISLKNNWQCKVVKKTENFKLFQSQPDKRNKQVIKLEMLSKKVIGFYCPMFISLLVIYKMLKIF